MTSSPRTHEELVTVGQVSERAQDLIATGTRWLTASEVARLASVDEGEIARWARDAMLFSIKRDGGAVFPEYAFGPDWHPLPRLKDILAIQERPAAILIAAWFESRSSYLGGQRPREVIGLNPDRVVAAAQSMIDSQRYAG